MSDPNERPPRFLGSHGDDWCVRTAELGPPDHVNGHVLHWLIVPGPPLSCYLAHVPPSEDPKGATFYHMHPETWSLHVVLGGQGRHFVDEHEHAIGPGTVIYQGPRVRHSIYPEPGHHLTHLSIQYPAAGYVEKEWIVCPEAGTTDRPGVAAAFAERFGSVDELMRHAMSGEIFSSPRWQAYVRSRRKEGQ